VSGKFLKAHKLRNARSSDARGAISVPACLKLKITRITSRSLDAKSIEDVDACSIARMRHAITTIVGPDHADAGLMIIPQ
jgi:hypothetical protein